MKTFGQLGIKVDSKGFEGDKISIDRVLNEQIIIHDYKIEESKFKKNGDEKCLHMQVEYKQEKRVIFINSSGLMEALKKVEKTDFPFQTTIIKQNKRLVFT